MIATLSKFSAAALASAALALAACDKLPPRWAFRAEASSVTVKLPPAKVAAPGFQFGSPPVPAAQDGASLNSA